MEVRERPLGVALQGRDPLVGAAAVRLDSVASLVKDQLQTRRGLLDGVHLLLQVLVHEDVSGAGPRGAGTGQTHHLSLELGKPRANHAHDVIRLPLHLLDVRLLLHHDRLDNLVVLLQLGLGRQIIVLHIGDSLDQVISHLHKLRVQVAVVDAETQHRTMHLVDLLSVVEYHLRDLVMPMLVQVELRTHLLEGVRQILVAHCA